ncbi:C3HC zinc finger-like-domain-containing protein [Scheffersomyces xylosifermentans]|uniref:C3HC zinc finger-like-domain-containing protein n=1 Tax=Scheffersomyces xylosifermentans TaxID=1304137 RepID=UPI00315D6957
MDPVFEMDFTAATHQVLNKCLDIFSTPTHEKYVHHNHTSSARSSSTRPDKTYSGHPDIQYFQKIKSKNHFNYHRSKLSGNKNSQNIDKIHSRMTVFDPYNVDFLVSRLKTFNAMNWHIPNFHNEDPERSLNELKCARNGWKCVSFSLNNNTKNHLLCTSCNQQLVLKFSKNLGGTKEYSAYDHEFLKNEAFEDNTDQLNQALHDKYLTQIETSGHSHSCSWRNFETALQGVYYPRPYLNRTNEFLIRDYLKNLKNLMDNSMILNEYVDNFSDNFISGGSDIIGKDGLHHDIFKQFVGVSNSWLLQRYFKNNKENFSVLLDFTPTWYYKLAMLGWSLNVQSFSNDLILLLICNKCNQRIFLNSSSSNNVRREAAEQALNLSTSKILTPCKYPVSSTESETTSEFVATSSEAEIEKFDPYKEHKPWCCNIANVASYEAIKLYNYVTAMIADSAQNIGPNGEYINVNESDMSFDSADVTKFKRRKSFDINDGLERLSKLRKLYIIDDAI